MSWGRSNIQLARCYLCREPGCRLNSLLGQGQPRGKTHAEGREAQSSQLLHSPCVTCTHPACVHMGQRETNPFKILCTKQSSTCALSLKPWLLGCRTSLALTVPRQARQKPEVCSAGCHQSCILASFFCYPFPKAQHHSKTREAVPGAPLPCCTPGSSKKGWHIPESISASLTGSQFLRISIPELSTPGLFCRAAVPSPHATLQRENRS